MKDMSWTKEKVKLIEKSSNLFIENRKLKRIINKQDEKLTKLYDVMLIYEELIELL
jgi:hypothetical protein